MDNRIFDLIDQATATICSDLELVVSSIDGAYAQVYRDDPSVRGLNRFIAQSAGLPDTAARMAKDGLRRYQDQTVQLRTAFNPDAPANPETLVIAPQQLRTLIESLRLLAARRFKAALVSRSSIAPPSAMSLRVLNRAGHQIQASDMIYLMTRKATIDLFNEAQIEGLHAIGQKVAFVHNRNPEHQNHGAMILIDDSMSGLPHYLDIQDKWFHPRSNAIIDRSV